MDWGWRHMLAILVLRRLSQEDHNVEINIGSIVSSRLAWAL